MDANPTPMHAHQLLGRIAHGVARGHGKTQLHLDRLLQKLLGVPLVLGEGHHASIGVLDDVIAVKPACLLAVLVFEIAQSLLLHHLEAVFRAHVLHPLDGCQRGSRPFDCRVQ